MTGPPGADRTDGVNGINERQGPPGITQLIPGTNLYLVTNSSGLQYQYPYQCTRPLSAWGFRAKRRI